MKRRLLCTILIVDGALVLAVAGLHIADHLSGVPCAPIHYSYYDCSVYFKLGEPATILLLSWGIGTLPVVLVIVGDWLETALRRRLRRLQAPNPNQSHPDA